MLFELRTYSILPGQAITYLDIFRKTGMHLITRHLPMLGYWMTESGELNAIQHMWVYESFEERLAKRLHVAADTEWNEKFVKQAFPLITQQKSRFYSLEVGSNILEDCVKSRNSIHKKQSNDDDMFAKSWYALKHINSSDETSVGEHIGQWKLLSGGKQQSRISLERHASSDGLFSQPKTEDEHQIIRPLSFSPLK